MILKTRFKDLPHVLEGKGYGIIEDCSSIYGLKSIVEEYSEKIAKNMNIIMNSYWVII